VTSVAVLASLSVVSIVAVVLIVYYPADGKAIFSNFASGLNFVWFIVAVIWLTSWVFSLFVKQVS